jgi:hypothetical protein
MSLGSFGMGSVCARSLRRDIGRPLVRSPNRSVQVGGDTGRRPRGDADADDVVPETKFLPESLTASDGADETALPRSTRHERQPPPLRLSGGQGGPLAGAGRQRPAHLAAVTARARRGVAAAPPRQEAAALTRGQSRSGRERMLFMPVPVPTDRSNACRPNRAAGPRGNHGDVNARRGGWTPPPSPPRRCTPPGACW